MWDIVVRKIKEYISMFEVGEEYKVRNNLHTPSTFDYVYCGIYH